MSVDVSAHKSDALCVSTQVDLEPLLVEQLRLQKRMWRTGALTLAAIMVVCGGLAKLFLSSADSQGIVGLAGMGLLVSCAFAIPSFGDPQKTRAAKTLRERAHEIVWIYLVELRGQSASQWVVLALEDGARVSFPAFEKGREADVFAAVARLVPRATQGFAPKHEMAFLKDPSSLREADQALR